MFCWEPSRQAFRPADFVPMSNPDRPKPASDPPARGITADAKTDQAHRDLDADALMALDQARKLKPGPKRAAASSGYAFPSAISGIAKSDSVWILTCVYRR